MSARISRGGFVFPVLSSLLVLGLTPLPARAQDTCTWRPLASWNSSLGGDGTDQPESFVLDEDGNLFVTGQTDSHPFYENTKQTSTKPGRDVFVAKVSADGKNVLWSEVLGADGDDSGKQVALSADAVYVVGTGLDDFVLDGRGQKLSERIIVHHQGGGGKDAFLAKLSRDKGELQWLLYLGGTSDDEGLGVAVSADGNQVYVAGRTQSGSGEFMGTTAGERGAGYDAFVTWVDVSSSKPNIVQTRFLGEASSEAKTPDDAAYTLLVNADAVFVGGSVSGAVKTEGDIYGTFQGQEDGFMAMLDPKSLTPKWFSYLGGELGSTQVLDLLPLSTSPSDILVMGKTSSSDFIQPALYPGDDVFALVMDSSGMPGHQMRLRLQGNQQPAGHAAIDHDNNVFMGGATSAAGFDANYGFDTSFDSNGNTGSPDGEGFVVMLDAQLANTLWSSYAGGNSSTVESVQGVAINPQGKLIVVGRSSASGFFPLPISSSNPGGENGFMFGISLDSTAPTVGKVTASFSTDHHIIANGSGFVDNESSIKEYVWSLLDSNGNTLRSIHTADAMVSFSSFAPVPGESYQVTVQVFNGVNCGTRVVSGTLVVPSSPPTSDGGTPAPDGGSSSDPGHEMDGSSGAMNTHAPHSPLGWSCASTQSGGLLGLLAVGALLRQGRRRTGAERGPA